MASMRVLPCLTATVLRSSASRTSRSASSRCDCFDIVGVLPRGRPGPTCDCRVRQRNCLGLFPGEGFAPAVGGCECPRPHAAVELRFATGRAIGAQIHRAAGRNALEKSLRAGRRDGADAGIALRGRFARGGGKDSSNYDPATLEHGRKSLAFFAIMPGNYAYHRSGPTKRTPMLTRRTLLAGSATALAAGADPAAAAAPPADKQAPGIYRYKIG